VNDLRSRNQMSMGCAAIVNRAEDTIHQHRRIDAADPMLEALVGAFGSDIRAAREINRNPAPIVSRSVPSRPVDGLADPRRKVLAPILGARHSGPLPQQGCKAGLSTVWGLLWGLCIANGSK
jgi:hypothetical protein